MEAKCKLLSPDRADRVSGGAAFERDDIWLTRIGRTRGDWPPVGVDANELLGEGFEARPALMATDVWMQRKKGEL